MEKLYKIECLQGAPLSSWDEPETLESILDRYHEQYLDFADEPISREEFTVEIFKDLWEVSLIEVTNN